MQLYMLRREQGRLSEVEDLVRRSVEDYPTFPAFRCALAQMAAELGYTAEAHAALEDLAANDFAKMPLDEDWLVSAGLLAETATAIGDVEFAARLYRRLLPYGDRVAAAIATISTGAVARNLALLAATMERYDDAEHHFEVALELNERIGARPWLAHTQDDYARMLAGRAEPGDRERALDLARRALEGFSSIGMERFAAEAARLSESLGAARAP